MKISNTGLELIKSFEGCRLTAYQDSVGVWTIGWGHTKGVYKGQKITQQQADDMLKDDMGVYESKVNKYNGKYNFNQNQFDALTSFAYNVGSIDQLTSNGTRTISQISNKFLAYNKAGGKVLAGLTRRRQAEKKLFDTPVSSSTTSSYSEEWVNGYWYEKDGSQTYPYKGDWMQDDKGWWFEDEADWYPKEKWQKIDGKWYYFKEDGYMAADEWIGEWYVGKDGAYDSRKKKTTTTTTVSSSYKVKVTAKALNVRASASKTAKVNKVVHQGEIYTITKTSGDWGYLSSGAGWIMLKFTSKV